MATSICLICKKSFYVRDAIVKKGFGKYCSTPCYILATKPPIYKNCIICNKEFRSSPSRNRQFCSRICFGISKIKAKDKINCKICNNLFEIKPYRKNKAIYCSSKCMGIDKRGKISALKGRKLPLEIRKKISATLQGIEINQWINFKLGENKLERKKFQDQMQKQVFERDNYTCQLCGQIGGKLQVDHIQSWADYVILRFSMDNCRTLCMACHYKITFGRNMPENVENWGHHSFERGVTK